MNKISSYFTALVVGAATLASCSDNWEQPAMSVPTFPEGTARTITIADLKAKYWQDSESYGTIIDGKTADGNDLVILGTITSTCNPGNIYKSLYLQDETGAICIGIDTSKVSEAYPQNLAMAINVNGLAIGRYNGAMQLGVLQGSGVNRITTAELNPHVQLDFFAGKMDTTEVSLADINAVAGTTDGKIKWQGRLVRIKNVSFLDAGKEFVENNSTTSRTLVDTDGNRIILYNSSYADFAHDILPTGTGDVVAILSQYRNTWQLLLNDINGLYGFDPIIPGEADPDAPQLQYATTLLNPDDANATTALAGWTLQSNSIWGWKTYNNASYLNASAYGTNADVESLAISPVFDLTAATTAAVSFDQAAKFQTSFRDRCGIQVREVGTTDWTNLAIEEWPAAGSWSFANTGNISLDAYAGKKIELAFRYGATATEADTWEIKNLVVAADAEVKVEITERPADPDTAGELTLLAETATNGIEGWTIGNASVWTWKTYNGASYLNGSAYGLDPAPTAEATAISPKIKVGEGEASLSFEHAAKFQDAGLRTGCSIAIREAGTTNFTTLTIPTWPEAGAWTWTASGAIDIKAFAGKTVEIAFIYGTGVTDTWEIRNLKLVNAQVAE